MSLKQIFREGDIDALEEGDRVKFVPEEIDRGYDNEFTLYRRPHPCRLIFALEDRQEDKVHLLEYNRGDLTPTQSRGFIRVRDRSTFVPSERTPKDPEYKTLKDLIEQSKH